MPCLASASSCDWSSWVSVDSGRSRCGCRRSGCPARGRAGGVPRLAGPAVGGGGHAQERERHGQPGFSAAAQAQFLVPQVQCHAEHVVVGDARAADPSPRSCRLVPLQRSRMYSHSMPDITASTAKTTPSRSWLPRRSPVRNGRPMPPARRGLGDASGGEVFLDPLAEVGHGDRVACVVGVVLGPRDAAALWSFPVLPRHVVRVGGQLVEQRRNRPHLTAERTLQHGLERLGQLVVGDGVTGEVDDFVADARFGEEDVRGEDADVFGRRHGDRQYLRLPAR